MQVLIVYESRYLNLLILYNEHDLEIIQEAQQKQGNLKASLHPLKEIYNKVNLKYLNLNLNIF